MKRLCFTYDLTLSFSQPVWRHTFLFRFAPASDESQQLWGLDMACRPQTQLPATRDAFGNRCMLGHIEEAHESLNLYVRGDAVVRGEPLRADCPAFYTMETPLTAADERIAALGEGLSGAAEEIAMQAAERVRAHVCYRQGVTNERTTALEALALGAGVCQDMAHLLLAVLRARHIPARYVAGLIPGEGETHAWVEVYDGTRFIGVDPTHLRLADDTYLRVNAGRDSRDCAINRGVFAGGAQQTMRVLARMAEV